MAIRVLLLLLIIPLFAFSQEEIKEVKKVSILINKKQKSLKNLLLEIKRLQKKYKKVQDELKSLKLQMQLLKRVSQLRKRDIEIYQYNLKKINKSLATYNLYLKTLNNTLEKLEKVIHKLFVEVIFDKYSFKKEKQFCDEYVMRDLMNKQKELLELKKNVEKSINSLEKEKNKIELWLKASVNIKEKKDITRKKIAKKTKTLEEIRKELKQKLKKRVADKEKLEAMIIELSNKKEYLKKIIEDKTQGFIRKGYVMWPVKGDVIESFSYDPENPYEPQNNPGINIAAPVGSNVKSVANGIVIYAGWFNGFGNLVIVDHGNKIYTLYAHLQKIYVKEGEVVKKGKIIGTVGDTGSLKGPMLHFEVRLNSVPQDPLKWLMPR